ncbi:MAG: hypothetical protein F4X64_06960 [Chloroflexi bacterium]|nr:hypothetical protein [Chloroflexota bacterium]
MQAIDTNAHVPTEQYRTLLGGAKGMKNHVSGIRNILRRRTVLAPAGIVAGSIILLSLATGCGASGPAPASTQERTSSIQQTPQVSNSADGENVEVIRVGSRADLQLRLFEAALEGDTETLRRLLREGADPNETHASDVPPLLWLAVESENLEVVQILLDAGADPDQPGPDGSSSAALALKLDNQEILAAISGAGGSAAIAPGNEVQDLLDAVDRQNADLLKVVLESGADPNTLVPATSGFYIDTNADGVRDLWMAPILYIAVSRDQPDTVRVLLEAGADPDARGFIYLLEGDDGNRQDSIAAALGVPENPDIESGPYGNTSLHRAIENENVAIVEALLQAGANTEALTQRDETALILAVNKATAKVVTSDENIKIVEALLQAGANTEALDRFGETPLILAVESDNTVVVTLLIEVGANLDVVDRFGRPLSAGGNEEIEKILSEAAR